MIFKVLEYDYKGFHLVLDEENGGWNCIIGENEIKFPTAQNAEAAICEILKNADSAIKQNEGVKVRKVSASKVTNSVEIEKPY